jgi:hypothetical protein
MLRRSALSLLLVAGLALTGAACGGSSGTSGSPSTTSTTSGSSGASDADAVLASIKTNVGDQGPQKIAVSLTVNISGTPTDPTLGAFLTKPISLTLAGPVDSKAKKSDLTFSLAAGPIKVDGGLRQVGGDTFLEVNGKWYSLPADALSSVTGGSSGSTTSTTSTAASVNPQALLGAFGDPSKLFTDAKLVGSEDVDGIKSDHVSGDIDLAALVKGISSVAKSAGSPSASPVSPTEIAQSVAQLQQYVQSATADVWVGQDDKQLHRFATTVDGKMDAGTKASSGIDGFKLTLDVSATPTSTPSVSAPSSPAPIAQLEQDLGGLLGGLAGAGTTTG